MIDFLPYMEHKDNEKFKPANDNRPYPFGPANDNMPRDTTSQVVEIRPAIREISIGDKVKLRLSNISELGHGINIHDFTIGKGPDEITKMSFVEFENELSSVNDKGQIDAKKNFLLGEFAAYTVLEIGNKLNSDEIRVETENDGIKYSFWINKKALEIID